MELIRVLTGGVRNPRLRGDLLHHMKKKCMHETVYYHSVFIRRGLRNIVEEEEWADILKWDGGSRLQCHILYCSVLHNLSEMKKK